MKSLILFLCSEEIIVEQKDFIVIDIHLDDTSKLASVNAHVHFQEYHNDFCS